MKFKSESEVTQSCPTLSDPMDCSLPGSSVHGFSKQEYWSGVSLPSPVGFVYSLSISRYFPFLLAVFVNVLIIAYIMEYY